MSVFKTKAMVHSLNDLDEQPNKRMVQITLLPSTREKMHSHIQSVFRFITLMTCMVLFRA